jgi:hypothetical protein
VRGARLQSCPLAAVLRAGLEPVARLLQEAGYPEASVQLIKDVMMGKNIPDPRDIRKYDLVGALGMINYK